VELTDPDGSELKIKQTHPRTRGADRR